MKLGEEERRTMTKVAKKFYDGLSFVKMTGKGWHELSAEEREIFIQGQKWLYAYYKLAFKKGYDKGVDDAQMKINELVSSLPLTKGG